MHTIFSETVGFNPAPPYMMYVDIDSCFATIEQQANPLLRGVPMVVAAYTSGNGCILASSREAKMLGIKTCMPVREAKRLYPKLIVLSPDPEKYRHVHKKLVFLLQEYSSLLEVKSIDEMVLSFHHAPILTLRQKRTQSVGELMEEIGREIKARIRKEIGEWITVSIGIAPNRYLGKVASSFGKPDGLVRIEANNIHTVLSALKLEDLCGIKEGNASRLRVAGLTTAYSLYTASISQLRSAFHSVLGYHWWLRLHGWEADDQESVRKSVGHSHALYIPYPPDEPLLHQVLSQLVAKTGYRLRKYGYRARGIHVGCGFSDHGGWWGHAEKQNEPLFTDDDLYRAAKNILMQAPPNPVRNLAVTCFGLSSDLYAQEYLFDHDQKRVRITQAIDSIHNRWGQGTVTSARYLTAKRKVLDRISFGKVRDVEMLTFSEQIQAENFSPSPANQ